MPAFRSLCSVFDTQIVLQIKATIVAGMGLFSDSYDLFSIPIVMAILGQIYYDEDNHQVPKPVASIMLCIALLGAVIGQILFGVLGDRKHKLQVYGLALLLMVFSSIGCGFSVCKRRSCVLFSLGLFRCLLGIGIGGDYPLSATIMSQIANDKTRGSFIAAAFSMQGFGILVSSLTTMIVIKCFEKANKNVSEEEMLLNADLAWRIILMIGALPAALTYYWRIMMPETARLLSMLLNKKQQSGQDSRMEQSNYSLLSKQFFRRHGRDLFSCAASWLLVDIAFYGSSLFQSQIYKQYLKLDQATNVYQVAFKLAMFQAIIAICFTIPGYWVTFYLIDKIGRTKIQMMGFFFMGVIYLALGIPYSYWSDNTNKFFMFLYGLTFFFSNFGPNTTTFIVPAELFPSRFRATCHGISGASGKVGALIGVLSFSSASTSVSYMRMALIILGGVCLLGMAVTFLFTTETKERPLVENEKDGDDVKESELSLFRRFTSSTRPSSSSFEQGTPRTSFSWYF